MKKNKKENQEELFNNMDSIQLQDFVTKEYREYQIYTLLDRAIPYLNDGLKPAQRRILYTFFKNKNKGLQKVSSATGLVLSLHPHGPASIESSIVNMAQDYVFSNNYPLIDKKGYFGERMEQNAAASRYIEAKLSHMAEVLLFDDLNQAKMTLSYDERNEEPEFLLPKLPLMLLNGAEGIGTGYSSMIPSYHHKDIIDSMIQFLNTGKAKKIKPFVDGYKNEIIHDKIKNKFSFQMKIEKIDKSFFITELPKGFDAQKIYRHLNNLIEEDFLKDFTDSSETDDIKIELIFKKGFNPRLETIISKVNVISSITPNFTLISGNDSDHGVEIFNGPEEIIEIFTSQRLEVIKKRYELLYKECMDSISKDNEIIRFIKEKHYAVAESKKDRSSFIAYLKTNKFIHIEYLADMAIYRMTQDEVAKRKLLVDKNTADGKIYKAIIGSKQKIQEKLIEELTSVNAMMNNFLKDKRKRKEDDKKKKN